MNFTLGFTDKPTKARIYQDLWTDTYALWAIDGVDRQGRVTKACVYYDSFHEAVKALPEFWAVHIASNERPAKSYYS